MVLKWWERQLKGPGFLLAARQVQYLLFVISKQSKIWKLDIDSLAEKGRGKASVVGMEPGGWICFDGRMFYKLFKNNTIEGI